MIRSYAKYVIIVVNYFSMWAEVELLMSIKRGKPLNAFEKNLIYSYGIANAIVSDNTKQLDN